MAALVIQLQSARGSTFGRLLADVREWCHARQIEPVAFTHTTAGDSPEIYVEFRTDAEMDLFALNFTGGARLLFYPALDFTVDFTI